MATRTFVLDGDREALRGGQLERRRRVHVVEPLSLVETRIRREPRIQRERRELGELSGGGG